MERRPIAEVIARHAPALMEADGVIGVYESARADGTPCIKVIVLRRSAEIERRLPAQLEGHPVVIEESDQIRAMPDSG